MDFPFTKVAGYPTVMVPCPTFGHFLTVCKLAYLAADPDKNSVYNININEISDLYDRYQERTIFFVQLGWPIRVTSNTSVVYNHFRLAEISYESLLLFTDQEAVADPFTELQDALNKLEHKIK